MPTHNIDWSQWAVVGPLLNTFVIALVCYVLTYLKCRVEELQKAIEQRAVTVLGDRRQDGPRPPATKTERRGPAPGRRQLDRLREHLQQQMAMPQPPAPATPAPAAPTGATTEEVNNEPDN